jgi:hypothetical protein
VDIGGVLLVHRAFYGWAMLNLNVSQIMLYEYDNPANAAQTVAGEGQGKIYLIWWINGAGWYGQPTVPALFREVYHSGEIALYKYDSIARTQNQGISCSFCQ